MPAEISKGKEGEGLNQMVKRNFEAQVFGLKKNDEQKSNRLNIKQ